ncbi:MAG: pyridoxal phosphate-dependent aminotransferase [Desulfobacterales bacterium]
MIIGHGGNIHLLARQLGCRPEDIIDMSSNMNPLGPPPGLMDHLSAQLDSIFALPEADADRMKTAAADWHRISPAQVLGGNGTTQFIYSLPRALNTRKAMILAPTYADYTDACRMEAVAWDYLFTRAEDDFMPDISALDKTASAYDTVFICNPNNPTGRLIPAEELARLCRKHADTFFIIDESYLPFVLNGETESLVNRGLENAVILSSMSKIFRIPGLRVGFAIGPETVIQKLSAYAMPWSVNSLAQEAICYLFSRPAMVAHFIKSAQNFAEKEKTRFTKAFQDEPDIRFYPSATGFLLAELKNMPAEAVWTEMARHRFLIRDCSNFRGLSDRFIRISLKTVAENEKAAQILKQIVRNSSSPQGRI